jgi:hypothetical protein
MIVIHERASCQPINYLINIFIPLPRQMMSTAIIGSWTATSSAPTVSVVGGSTAVLPARIASGYVVGVAAVAASGVTIYVAHNGIEYAASSA